jgi:hypothetical protein
LPLIVKLAIPNCRCGLVWAGYQGTGGQPRDIDVA